MALRAPFTRSDDRWLGGVAAGLASRLGIDPALIRSALLLLTLAGGLGLILYGLGWIFLPDGAGSVLLLDLFKGRPQSGLVGGAVMLIVGLFRPILWWWADRYYGIWEFATLSVWALFLAGLLTAIALFLAWRARRRRESLGLAPGLQMVPIPLTVTLDAPTAPLPAASGSEQATVPLDGVSLTAGLDAPTAPLPAASGSEQATVPLDGVSLATEPQPKTWFARSNGTDSPTLARPAPPPVPPRPRRPKAGSRHVQATLAATLLTIAAVAAGNAGEVTIRSLAQILGAVAIIWGLSVAIAAARGRRAAGTVLIATLAGVACLPPLMASSLIPATALAVPIDINCGQWAALESRDCALTAASYSIDDAAAEQIIATGEPVTLTSGFGNTSLWIDTEVPVIITATFTSGSIGTLLPDWTVDENGRREVLDGRDVFTDIQGNEYYAPAWQGFRVTNSTITFASPGAVPGEAAEIHLVGGFGSLNLDSAWAHEELDRVYDEMNRADLEWQEQQEDAESTTEGDMQ